MANGIGLGARDIISFRVDKGCNRAAQRRHANTRFQERANFLKKSDSKRSDKITRPSRQDPDRTSKQSVYGVCFLDVDLRSYDRAAADCPIFCHTFHPIFSSLQGWDLRRLSYSCCRSAYCRSRSQGPNCAPSFYLVQNSLRRGAMYILACGSGGLWQNPLYCKHERRTDHIEIHQVGR